MPIALTVIPEPVTPTSNGTAAIPEAHKCVPRPETLSADEETARDHFQKCIDYLAKSFELVTKAEDRERFDRILGKVFYSIFEVTGSCKKRGFCCRNFTLYTDGRFIRNEEEFEAARKHQPDWSGFKFSHTEGQHARFNCSHLDQETNLCKVYESRPDVCRTFPHSGLPRGQAPDTGCGFKFRVRFFLPKITNRPLLDRVAALLIQMQHWQEAAHMYEQAGFVAQAAVLKAQHLVDEKRYELAISELARAENVEPDNTDLLECLAVCHLKFAESAFGS